MREIESKAQFRQWIASGARPEAAVQGLDLESETEQILGLDFAGSLFIACSLAPEAAHHVISTGGMLIPRLPGFAFEIHRPSLYSPAELYAGFDPDDTAGFGKTVDQRIYRQYRDQGGAMPKSILVSLARRLHDHSITDALQDLIAGRKVVAVMGGHAMERAEEDFARVARIARRLSRAGFLMVSGGGPGAMEATHLGAYFTSRDEEKLAEAITMISARPEGAEPNREYADPDWLYRAWEVLQRFPIAEGAADRCMSVAVPTWHYGHEPPTPFATHIAKYFANSVREDGLLMIANHGVIFARGSAGTTQEIFQDAAQNHYGVSGQHSPMILLGAEFWTHHRPVWPLLESVSGTEPYGELVALTDSEDEVVRRIMDYDPAQHRRG